MKPHLWTRRQWLRQTVASGLAMTALPPLAWGGRDKRSFHVCLSPPVVEAEPELLEAVRRAGVSAVWLAGYFYGHRPYTDEQLRRARNRVERAGLAAHLITVPLGHPGDSLGSTEDGFPLTPPRHWQLARRPDRSSFAGTSLHQPASEENSAALRQLRKLSFRRGFLDDDFRLARGPGEIGGCYCDAHRQEFLRLSGLPNQRWAELLDDVQARRLSPLLRSWLNYQCDALTASFRLQRRAFGGGLGVMVMYLGAEKAGIRLADYRRNLFRVGELMFSDGSFAPVKGKTDELFSVLFHRRFTSPDLAYSETTAYPAHTLSAANMAAKLVISTIADVRQTMFMSGLTPFPREHWAILGPAMSAQARLHNELAGHQPRGPLKHFWGEAERWVGDDRPFSLWLAMGVPFEVADTLPKDGCVFLSDFDARELAAQAPRTGARLFCRSSAPVRPAWAETTGETLAELFALKHRLGRSLDAVPHILEDEPAVCAWYPTAHKVLVWNLCEQPRTLTVALRNRRQPLRLSPLQAAVVNLGASSL
ncbi:MAG TPA: hypothetical protein PKI20_13705 [Verrucomicrobiota bacterium]|nr:hypothetical protein [Verrucomicrobiota bacterium]HQL78751.1 hypothetical protein [Verrucomicrobiota bacterium]